MFQFLTLRCQDSFQIFEKYLTFCGVGIQNAQLFEASVLEYKKNQLLLSLAKSLFQEQSSLDRLITTIIREAKDMLKCERCTVFLLDLKMYDQVSPSSENALYFILRTEIGIFKYLDKNRLCSKLSIK